MGSLPTREKPCKRKTRLDACATIRVLEAAFFIPEKSVLELRGPSLSLPSADESTGWLLPNVAGMRFASPVIRRFIHRTLRA